MLLRTTRNAPRRRHEGWLILLCGLLSPSTARPQADPKDWPMYNGDPSGSRHNRGEKAIGPENAGRLEEKWRFPAAGSGQEIGVIHATPVVVNGHVYFGTASEPAFYKLAPDGSLRWSYRNPERKAEPAPAAGDRTKARLASLAHGIVCSALVTDDTVFFGDLGGWFYALDRATGAERWKLNARAAPFPGPHPLNVFFSSPIPAGGRIIAAGGALEQLAAASSAYRGSTGRGFVLALEPRTGRIEWKYDVGAPPEPLDPPVTIKDSWGDHVFYFGPATSTVWSTPSFDAVSGTIFFGTDVNTAPRRPTKDDPRLHTRESCGVIALGADGSEKWVTQLTPGDVWTNSMRAYDPGEKRYKDQSVGDTPKVYTIESEGKATRVVGVGSKNGGFYVLRAEDGKVLEQTPIYTGPPAYPLNPPPDPRTIALPSPIGGIQTGCATDGTTIYTNGIDALRLGTQELAFGSIVPPTGGRVVALSADARSEKWRHERPRIPSLGGPSPEKPVFKDAGDPVASGVAVANGVVYFTGVASGKLVALDAARGAVLREIEIGPVWAGPSVSRGRVYIGTGNTLFIPFDFEGYFPKRYTGVLHSFGLPGEDEVDRLRAE